MARRGLTAETRSCHLRVVFGHHQRSLTIQGPSGPVIDAVRAMFADAQLARVDPSAPPDLTFVRTPNGLELRSRTDPGVERFTSHAELVGALEFAVTHFLLGGLGHLRELGAAAVAPPLVDGPTREARYDPVEAGGWARGTAGAAVVARIAWSDGEPARVRPLSAAEGLELLIGSVLDTGAAPLDSFPRFADLLEGARVVDVRFGEAAQAARALEALLP